MGINRVVIVGNLVRDAELKYSAGGQAVSKFSIAVNRRGKEGNEWVDMVSFFDVAVFGRLAESINQYLTKGAAVCVDGELRQERWERDGQNRSKVEIIANNVRVFNSRGNGNGNAPLNAEAYQYDDPLPDNFTDDIPF